MNQLLWMEWIEGFLANDVVRWVLDFLSFIPKIMYFLVACLCSIIDMFQVVFRKLAGLDPVIIDGNITQGDTAYELINKAIFQGEYPVIQTVFWSLIVLGVIMLIVTSIMATIRLEYNPDKDKGNSKSNIIKNLVTGIFQLLIIPVACVFTMFLTNSLIGVIDTITTTSIVQNDSSYQYFDTWTNSDVDADLKEGYENSYIAYDIFGIKIPTKSEPFSGMVFKASAYSCNRFRLHGASYLAQVNSSITDLGIFSNGKINESSTAANIIDTAFAINAKIKTPVENNVLSVKDSNGEDVISTNYYSPGVSLGFGTTNNESFSKYNVNMVWFFYDLWSFNFIIGFVALIVIGKLYATFCLALMARVFEIIGLFIASPIVIGIMPIDNGSSLGRWRQHFAAKFGLVLLMVFGMNIITPILEIMQQIQFFGAAVVDYIINTILIVAALSAVDGLVQTISTVLFDKPGEAYKNAKDTATAASGNLQAGLNATATAARVGVAPALMTGRAAVGLGSGAVSLVRAANDHWGAHGTVNERNAIRQGMTYDAARRTNLETQFAGMSSTERRDWGDTFLDSAEGQSFMQQFKGANDAEKRQRALEAIENNKFDGRKIVGGNAAKDGLMDSMYQYQHNQDLFEHTQEGEGLASQRGSAEYNAAFAAFNNMNQNQQVEAIRGGTTALNTQQAGIRQARQRVQQQREQGQQNWQNVSQNIQNFFGNVNQGLGRVFNPFFAPLETLSRLIPGRQLFPTPPAPPQNNNN